MPVHTGILTSNLHEFSRIFTNVFGGLISGKSPLALAQNTVVSLGSCILGATDPAVGISAGRGSGVTNFNLNPFVNRVLLYELQPDLIDKFASPRMGIRTSNLHEFSIVFGTPNAVIDSVFSEVCFYWVRKCAGLRPFCCAPILCRDVSVPGLAFSKRSCRALNGTFLTGRCGQPLPQGSPQP